MGAFFVLFQRLFLTDKAAAILLLFFNRILEKCSIQYRFPVTPSTVKQQVGYSALTKNVKRFIICPKCDAIYEPDPALAPFTCPFVRFPNHTSAHKRSPCGARLFLDNGKRKPCKGFAYNSLIDNLYLLFNRPGLEEQIENGEPGVSTQERCSMCMTVPCGTQFLTHPFLMRPSLPSHVRCC